MKTTLESICNKYCKINPNDDNYSIGGGLDSEKFASRRHEEARSDEGKLTFGEATQLFKKATGLDIETIKEVINYSIPNMEWHHAGKLPKSYGGGMKKTYFLNATEICDLAKKWNEFFERLQISKAEKAKKEQEKRELEYKQLDFLKANATRVERVAEKPLYFYKTAQEMQGKYGWFDSRYKSYKLPEYYSGWAFETQEKYQEFFNIK